MATQTLRPNATVTSTGWTRTGGASVHGVLADGADDGTGTADATYMNANSDAVVLDLNLTTYALAAGERVKRIQTRGRLRHDGSGSGGQTRADLGYRSAAGVSSAADVYTDLTTGFSHRTGSWRTDLLAAGDQQALIDGLRVVCVDFGMASGNRIRTAELYVDLDVWEAVDAPTVSADPSGTITETDVPTIESYTAALNDGTPSLYSRQVRVFRDAVYLAGGFDPETETDVEWEQTDTSLGSVSTDSGVPDQLQVGEPLANGDTYRAYVRYGKNDVAGETLWSEWSNVQFTLNLTLPTAPTVDVAVDQPGGRQVVTVTTAAITHDTLERIRVERTDDGGNFVTIRGGLITANPDDGSALAGSTAYTFEDFDAPRGVAVQYQARVTEGITASGTTLTSAWTTASPVAHPIDGHTWMFDVGTWAHVGPVRVLQGVSRSPSEQAGEFHPIGRRTAVVVTAGRGPDQLAFQVFARDHQDDVDDVEALMTSTRPVLVKWPNGTQDYIRVRSRPVDELDLGGERRRRWSIQAVQVADGITADG